MEKRDTEISYMGRFKNRYNNLEAGINDMGRTWKKQRGSKRC